MRPRQLIVLVLLPLLAVSHSHAQSGAFQAYLPYIRQTAWDLYVGTGTQIIRYDAITGTRLNVAVPGGQPGSWPAGFAFGPDENLYVSDGVRVQRYNPLTGDLIDTFIDLKQAGFVAAYNLTFGPDGNLYVAGQQARPADGFYFSKVARFGGTTGVLIDDFVPQLAGVQTLVQTIRFSPDGDLYVLGSDGAGYRTFMQRYSGSTGAFIDTIIAANDERRLSFSFVFGADDNMYVIGDYARVFRFNSKSGSLTDTFIPSDESHLRSAVDLAFGPHGNLYFVRQDTGQVVQYNGTTGTFIDIFIEPGSDVGFGGTRLVFYPKLEPPSSTK